MSEEPATSKSNSGANTYIKLIFLALLLAGVTLPFHYIPDRLIVFPKEQMTFSHTFITQKDIDYIIERYNNADNIFEQQAIANEPLVRKLTEKGLIVDRNSDDEYSDEYEGDDFLTEDEDEIEDAEPGEPLDYLNENALIKFREWENYLIDNSIFDCISKTDCEKNVELMKLYNSGESDGKGLASGYPMHIDNPRYLVFEFNNDGIDDYIIWYGMENCVNGNGWTQDFVFLVSENHNNYRIDMELADDVKSQFLSYANEFSEMDPHVFKEDGYIQAKGLNFTSAKGGVVSGSFALSGTSDTKWPSIEGTFRFDALDGKLTLIKD